MSWDLHEVCIEVASILQCMYLAVWRIENCNNGGASYSTTIMPQYSARCCSSVFSKQPSHAGAKEIVTLKFGESLAPFEVFQPFFAMSEMLVLVAAPPKKRRPMRKFCILVAFWVGVCIQHQRGCVKTTPFRPVVTFPPVTDIHCV